MRPSEDFLDPDVVAELEAIDATLAGEPVDPSHAELAELALLLVAARPEIPSESARSLDERLAPRLGGEVPARRRRLSLSRPQWSVAVAGLAAAAVVAFVVVPGGPKENLVINGPGVSSSAPSREGPISTASRHPKAPAQGLDKVFGGSAPSQTANGALGAANGSYGAPVPAPTPTARKTIQSAQLQLGTPSRWINVVAQEVFDVVGQEKGIVRTSQVTSGAGNSGYANFTLSIPSANLADTLSRLSAVQHARVLSRTDGTQDVNGQYLSDQRRLADARALRTSLLKQLAAATTQTQIDSLKAQIHDAEASIASDESTLSRLNGQINFSQLVVNVNSSPVIMPLGQQSKSSSGFTLGRAAHDALRVLTVAAGVALITLAALLPLALLVALGLWIALWVRRRRREQALDAA